jgi:hypothetical protein
MKGSFGHDAGEVLLEVALVQPSQLLLKLFRVLLLSMLSIFPYSL